MLLGVDVSQQRKEQRRKKKKRVGRWDMKCKCDVLLHTRGTLRFESELGFYFFSCRADDHLCESVNVKKRDL